MTASPGDSEHPPSASPSSSATDSPEVPPNGGGDRLTQAVGRLVFAERVLALAMLAVILVTMGAQVIARYVFGAPFSWSEEVARLAMIWLTFLAASYVMAEGGHITVDLWSTRVSDKVRIWFDGAVYLIVAGTCLLLFAGGLRFVLFVHPVGSPSLGIPKSLWYGAVSVGLLLMAIHSLLNLIVLIRTGQPVARKALADDEGFHLEMKVEGKNS